MSTETKAKHTALPWICHSGAVWQDGPNVYPKGTENGIPIAKMDREPQNGTLPVERDENAAFITRACNSHYALLEAAEHFREWFANHFEDFDMDTNAQLLCLDNEAAAAIAAVKKERQ